MRIRALAIVAAAAMAVALTTPALAQDTQPAQPTPIPTQPATTPAQPNTMPAGSGTTPAQASTGSNANSSASSAPPTPSAKTPPKRVWTDEDMNDLRSSSPISTVGAAKSANGKTGAKAAGAPRTKTAQYYHDQITKLQAQLPPIDRKMKALQDAIEGKPVTEARQFGWTKPGDWHGALAQLQKQRDDINSKIAALEDQARRSGVPENQIP